ncbi:unnamed protein product [Mycena citricolor]|uniref:Uncharacterized protein n=1 Tax=Mycena citricolor TaxID=2018698 RepID=A0AAD2K4S5_9AGAR|nr:unnamed protein product [Mycena citricolor]
MHPPPHPPLVADMINRTESAQCDPSVDPCRQLFNILWGCLATIFACVWVSVHPNVPPSNQGAIRAFWSRLKIMLIAVIAPEIVVVFAARQFLAARQFANEHGVSMAHGFFFAMGGFVDVDRRPIFTNESLEQADVLNAIRAVRVADIEDKSKGDAFSKGIALLQGLWFIVQCIARTAQGLPVSELEVSTLAFAILNIFMWALWWHKPLGVQEGIVLMNVKASSVGKGPKQDKRRPPRRSISRWFEERLAEFGGVFVGDYWDYFQVVEDLQSVPMFWSTDADDIDVPIYGRMAIGGLGFLAEAFFGLVFGTIHCVAWNSHFPSVAEKLLWRRTEGGP